MYRGWDNGPGISDLNPKPYIGFTVVSFDDRNCVLECLRGCLSLQCQSQRWRGPRLVSWPSRALPSLFPPVTMIPLPPPPSGPLALAIPFGPASISPRVASSGVISPVLRARWRRGSSHGERIWRRSGTLEFPRILIRGKRR